MPENVVTAEILEIEPKKQLSVWAFFWPSGGGAMSSILQGPDGELGFSWCSAAPELLEYHDIEWGYLVDDDIRLFEKLCLESFQSGLS